ncbi:MAG: hypothetical protein IKC80_08330 [Kiritimatiellae bacterium]|nr:hypothetical protein [Kiritimatiellia bacterium]
MEKNKSIDTGGKRLFALDLLRGLDIFALTVLMRLYWAANRTFELPQWLKVQFSHVWATPGLVDFAQPLFLFVCGAAVPFAVPKRLSADGRATARYWKHVAYRVAMLWVSGMIIQGQLLSFDISKMHPYNNTLQTIAVGYLAAALTMLVRSAAVRIAVPVALAAVYGGSLWICGDWTAEGNLARLVDERVFAAIGCRAKSFTYVATSLVWAAIGIAGMHAALILKSERGQWAKVKILSATGVALCVAGAAVLPWVPPIRHIYSLSFSLISTGLSFLLLAFLYVVTDIKGYRSHWGYFLLFGEFAFLSWWLHTFFGPALLKTAELCLTGVPHLMGTDRYMPLINELGLVAVFAGVLYVRKIINKYR